MTSITEKIIGNTLWLLLQRIGSRLLTFFLMMYLARGLGSLEFGKFTFATSFSLLFISVSDLGITTLTIREVARDKEGGSTYVGGTVTLKAFLSILAFLVMAIVLALIHMPADTRMAAYLLSASVVLRNLGMFFGTVFQAFEDMKYVAISELTQKILTLFACLILLYHGYGLIAISIVYCGSGLCYCVLNIAFVYWKFMKPHYRIDLRFWKESLKEALPLAAVAIISMVYYNIDMVMLGKMKGEEVVGWYGASYHLFFALATLTGALLSAAFPMMSRFFTESEDLLKKAYQKSFKLIMAAGMPISMGGFLLSERIIFLVFGPQYTHSVHIFKILSLIIIFSCINGLAGYFLTAINRQTSVAKVLAAITCTNVLLNLILIPPYSYKGAVAATLICEILCFLAFFASLPTQFRYLPLGEIIKSLTSSAFVGLLIVLMMRNEFSLPLMIGIAAATYFVAMWVTGFITEEDKTKLQEVFLQRKTE